MFTIKDLKGVRDKYPTMTKEERETWYDGLMEMVGMEKVFNKEDDDLFTEKEQERLNAFRKCVSITKQLFVEGIDENDKDNPLLKEYKTLWSKYNLDKGFF